MPDFKDPREEDIVYGDRRISRPDSQLPDWEVPDAAYRPVPIVWFTGAFFVHLFVLIVLSVILMAQPLWLVIAICGAATGGIGQWTWNRGMRDAALGWRVATVMMLAVNLFFAAAAASIP